MVLGYEQRHQERQVRGIGRDRDADPGSQHASGLDVSWRARRDAASVQQQVIVCSSGSWLTSKRTKAGRAAAFGGSKTQEPINAAACKSSATGAAAP